MEVKNLNISFTGKQPFTVVNNLSFSIGRGKTLAIVGESGSGKSLTALALMGLQPTGAVVRGTMQLHHQADTIYDLGNADSLATLRGSQIGIVFQEPMSALNTIMKIGLQVQEAIAAHTQHPEKACKQQAIEWLHRVHLPTPNEIFHRYPHQLSGGQKQRVMIAIAMCNHPALLIADEPTTALDASVQHEIISLMQYLQEEHQTAMMFITHDLTIAAEIADDALVMYKGETVEYGSAAQVLQTPTQPYTRALLACRPTPAMKGKRLPIVSDFMEPATVQTVKQTYEPAPIQDETLLSVTDLCVWYANEKNAFGTAVNYHKAVDGVTLSLKKGETLGLTGESGCGKSTLCRTLVGLTPIHSGQINFKGEEITELNAGEWRNVRKQIQMVFQDPYASLNPRMTIGDALAEPLLVHGILKKDTVQAEVHRLLDLVHLPADTATRYPQKFSGGQRQRIGIARALAVRPSLLICDESVSALDVSIQAQILNLLKDLQTELQLTYLFVSHDINVVNYMSDRVVRMQGGKICYPY